jgi:hypothetical protein
MRVIMFLLVVATGCQPAEPEPKPAVAVEPPPPAPKVNVAVERPAIPPGKDKAVSCDADEVIAIVGSNEVKARSMFHDKWIDVTGNFGGVTIEDKVPHLSIKKSKVARTDGRPIVAIMDKKAERKLATLNEFGLARVIGYGQVDGDRLTLWYAEFPPEK